MTERRSIQSLMAWVAVVALNLAVFRALYTTRRLDILVGGVAFWVALQVGAILVIWGRVRSRFFWQGFVGGGTIASFFLIAVFSSPKSAAGKSWKAYLVVADRLLLNDKAQSMLAGVFGNVWGELAEVLIFTAIEFLPLVLAALVGAMCAHRIGVTNDLALRCVDFDTSNGEPSRLDSLDRRCDRISE